MAAEPLKFAVGAKVRPSIALLRLARVPWMVIEAEALAPLMKVRPTKLCRLKVPLTVLRVSLIDAPPASRSPKLMALPPAFENPMLPSSLIVTGPAL